MNPNSVVYRRTVVPAKQSPDGESPTEYAVTQEASGFALWVSDHDGCHLLEFFHGPTAREQALERATYKASLRLPGLGKQGSTW